jgi:uncharacterized protein YbjT (DUF2867 family)
VKKMHTILVAGGTGYLGRFLVIELLKRGYHVRAIVRNSSSLQINHADRLSTYNAEVTKPQTLTGCCDDIDVVISTIGITRQKDGFTYMDVDYQANVNLLEEAKKSGVKKFIYVSVLNGERLRNLRICHAKEMFVKELRGSGIPFCIIRPNGFFSDMAEYFKMASKGRVYLFGSGDLKANPIHGEDLAVVCSDEIIGSSTEVNVGGPQTLTQKEIAESAFRALGKQPKIIHFPDWLRSALLRMVRMFTGSRTYGPIEFFLTVMAIDMVAPEYGKRTLGDFFADLAEKQG